MLQEKFLELAQKEEALQDQLNQVREELKQVMTDLKEGTYLQDPSTLTVYKIVKPQGRFVYYSDLDYKRTAKEGEKGGGGVLSKKEAQEAGFYLK